MKIVFTFLLLIVIKDGWSQTAADTTTSNIWGIHPDSTYRVFAKKGYIRARPSVSGTIIDSVFTGDVIIAKEQTGKFETVRNICAPWIKVVLAKNKGDGFLWAGSLALKVIPAGEATFLYGIDRIEKQKPLSKDDAPDDKLVIQIKVIVGDSLADMKEWKTASGEASAYNEAILLGNTRLTNLKDVVRVSFGGEACGIPMNFWYYGWTGTNLIALPGKYTVGDAGVFYHTETLLFPNEKGGEPGKIIRLIEEEEVLEESANGGKEKVKHSSNKEIYVWDGGKAIKQRGVYKRSGTRYN